VTGLFDILKQTESERQQLSLVPNLNTFNELKLLNTPVG
jgi:hypothetical protein